MSRFEYLTRDGSSPEGKPRILLSVHPADRHIYFDRLVKEIFSAYDCVVFFDICPNDDNPVEIEDLQLIIIAVTEKYLTWKNSGFTSEFLTLIEHGIPVLPIMLENGIVNLFNTRCGKLQYIDYTSTEAASKYSTKLCRHLKSVLSGNKECNDEKGKLKVFISYRKQDKEELKKLVDLIHANPESQRIHLWYDSNLLPGEDYRKTIVDALCDCDLFILLVTPSLLEKDNYIMRVEYPLAKEAGKKILPIEMKKTNKVQLAELYPSLPKCITYKQTDALFTKLLRF